MEIETDNRILGVSPFGQEIQKMCLLEFFPVKLRFLFDDGLFIHLLSSFQVSNLRAQSNLLVIHQGAAFAFIPVR